MSFKEAWQNLVLERFLARIAKSQHRDNFIFKGGMLLARYIDIGRETRDLDFLVRKISQEKNEIKKLVEEIAGLNTGDGFLFFLRTVDSLEHSHMQYPGFVIALEASFSSMRQKFSVDIGIGDVVTPINGKVPLAKVSGQGIFDGEISLFTSPPRINFC